MEMGVDQQWEPKDSCECKGQEEADCINQWEQSFGVLADGESYIKEKCTQLTQHDALRHGHQVSALNKRKRKSKTGDDVVNYKLLRHNRSVANNGQNHYQVVEEVSESENAGM